MFPKINPESTDSWNLLINEAANHQPNIVKLLEEEVGRLDKFTIPFLNFYFDFSKNDINSTTLDQLIHLADECQLKNAIEAQFNGYNINETEDRAVLHTSLRNLNSSDDKAALVKNELNKIKNFTQQLISGEWLGYSGKPITDIVNIGIGGSDLGPKMVTYALKPFWQSITPHFVSNVDAAQMVEELEPLNPETTLFIIASKTFTTQETMTNAETAKNWFLKHGSTADIAKHFVAVSTNKASVVEFGIDPSNMFEFWNWVGGRYSLWSAIGLPIACTVGYETFEELLNGAHAMDTHFREAELKNNIPVIAALIGIWYNNFLGYESMAILPYDHRLRYLPSYLQQADMESNGKCVDRNGTSTKYQTGPIIWGEPGTNGQHAFYQLIHQGTKVIPCEFIAAANPAHEHKDHHEKLLANFFAQPEALLNGKSKKQVVKEMDDKVDENLIPFKVFEGNRPSTSILMKELNAFNLGALIAYYEHKIFVQGVIWNVFSYDQWGVELGKQLAKPILSEIKEKRGSIHDKSTTELMDRYFKFLK